MLVPLEFAYHSVKFSRDQNFDAARLDGFPLVEVVYELTAFFIDGIHFEVRALHALRQLFHRG